MKTMLCPNCGSKLENDSLFCNECKTAIDGLFDEDGGTDATQFVENEIDFGDNLVSEGFGETSDPFAILGTSNTQVDDAPVDTTIVAPHNQRSASFAADAKTPHEETTNKPGGNKMTPMVAVIAIVAVLAIAAVAFFMSHSQASATYTIQFETDGGTAITAQQVEEGMQVTSPSNPTKDGYDFVGWYSNPERTDQVTFPFAAAADIVLYAKWEETEGGTSASPSSNSVGGTTTGSSPSASTGNSEGSYIIPNSSYTLLSQSDLISLSDDDLEIAMNEIWARHGRMFKNNWLQSYFNSQPWYTGTIAADDFLNQYTPTTIENENAKLIGDMLSERGYNLSMRHPD